MIKVYLGWFGTCLRNDFGIWFEEHLGYWAHSLRCTLVYFYMFEAHLGTWLLDVMVHILVHGLWMLWYML